jgi:hypothetical protein
MRTPIIALAALLLSACWQPGYDPDLIESERFADRLGKPEDSFTLTIQGDSSGDGYYLPPRDPAYYRQGFGIGRQDGTVGIVAVTAAPDGSLYASSGGYGNYDVFSHSSYMVPTAVDNASLVVWMNPNEDLVRLTQSGYGTLNYTGSLSGAGYTGGGTVALSPAADRFFLSFNSLLMITVDYIDLTGAEAFPAVTTITATLPADALVVSEEKPAFVALSPDDSRLYLSVMLEDGSAATYYWMNPYLALAPTRLYGIDRKITGMLPDGRLYAADEDGMRVYESDGTGRFDLSYKKILYAGERWDAAEGRWLSRFTRATTASVDSEDGIKYRVEIWEHPTESLSRLAD